MFTEWTDGLGDGWIDNTSMHFPSALNQNPVRLVLWPPSAQDRCDSQTKQNETEVHCSLTQPAQTLEITSNQVSPRSHVSGREVSSPGVGGLPDKTLDVSPAEPSSEGEGESPATMDACVPSRATLLHGHGAP